MDEQDLNEPIAKVSLLKGTLMCFHIILNLFHVYEVLHFSLLIKKGCV